MKKRIRILLLVLLAGAALYAFDRLASRKEGGEATFSGTVEAVTVAPSFQVPGRITSLALTEGAPVTEGQVIGTLDDAELLGVVRQGEAALATARARAAAASARADFAARSARARLDAARAALDKARAGLRPQEVERARQAAAEARARSAAADDEARRAEELLAAGAVPRSRRDNATRAAEAARAALGGAEQALSLAEAGSRAEDIAAAEAAVASAEAELRSADGARLEAEAARRAVEQGEAELALARTRLSHATLRAPRGGVVLTRAVEVGEMAVPGAPVATLADLSSVTVRFYVPEPRAAEVRLGSPATVTTDATGERRFAGRVAFLSDRAEFTPKTIETREERVKLVYRAKVEVPNPDGALKPGMPATVELAPPSPRGSAE